MAVAGLGGRFWRKSRGRMCMLLMRLTSGTTFVFWEWLTIRGWSCLLGDCEPFFLGEVSSESVAFDVSVKGSSVLVFLFLDGFL